MLKPPQVPCPISGLSAGVLGAMSLKSIDALEGLLGAESQAVQDIRRLFELAKGYGYQEWLVFDPSVVRGLAYYTGGDKQLTCLMLWWLV